MTCGCQSLAGLDDFHKDNTLAAGGAASAPPSAQRCKAAALTAWSKPEPLGVKRTDGSTALEGPAISPDGLTLFAHGLVNGRWQMFRGERSDVGQSFASLAPLKGLAFQWAHPFAFALSGEQLYLTTDQGNGDLFEAKGTGTNFVLLPLSGLENLSYAADGYASLTADLLRIIWVHGPANALPALRWAQRGSQAESWVATVPLWENLSFSIGCLTLSPDGLALLYATNHDSAIRVIERPNRDTPFFQAGVAREIPALGTLDAITCPRAITPDGCELYLSSNRAGEQSLWRSRRVVD